MIGTIIFDGVVLALCAITGCTSFQSRMPWPRFATRCRSGSTSATATAAPIGRSSMLGSRMTARNSGRSCRGRRIAGGGARGDLKKAVQLFRGAVFPGDRQYAICRRPEFGASQQKGQMDCVDESTNTRALLLLSRRTRAAEVPQGRGANVSRGFFIDGRYPHWTAVISDPPARNGWSIPGMRRWAARRTFSPTASGSRAAILRAARSIPELPARRIIGESAHAQNDNTRRGRRSGGCRFCGRLPGGGGADRIRQFPGGGGF